MQKQRADQESGCECEPLRQSDILTISKICGDDNLVNETMIQACNKYGLVQWPRTCETASKPDTWATCVEQSPSLHQRLVVTDETELRKMFHLGERVKGDPSPRPEQVKRERTPVHALSCHVSLTIIHSTYAGACDRVHEA